MLRKTDVETKVLLKKEEMNKYFLHDITSYGYCHWVMTTKKLCYKKKELPFLEENRSVIFLYANGMQLKQK